MAEKVLSIEISPKLTKVCEIDHKDRGVIYGGFYFETPSEMVSNGIISTSDTSTNTFRLSLEEGLKKNNIKTRKVVFVVQASSIGIRDEVLPRMKDNRIREFIQTNTSQFFSSINSEDYKIIYRDNGSTEDDRMRATLFAVSKKIIEGYERLSDQCGLVLEDITLIENGIAQAMIEEYPVGCSINIDVESICTYLTIVKNGEVMQQRVIPFGLDIAVMSVAQSKLLTDKIGYIPNLEAMHDTKCFADDLDAISIDGKGLTDIATSSAEQLIGSVSRFLDYYLSQHSEDIVDRVIVSGLGSYLEGFTELLGSELAQSVESAEVNLTPRIVNKGGVDGLSIFMSAIYAGANKNGVGVDKKSNNSFDISSLKKDDEDFSVAKKFVLGCLGVFVLLIIIPLIIKFVYYNKYNKLQDEIAQLQEAKAINDEYVKTRNKYKDITEIEDMTVTANDDFLKMIKELEVNLPTDATVDAITADSSAVSIEIEAPTKSVCANTISALRHFKTLSNIQVSEVTSTTDENGNVAYSFTLDANYTGNANK